MDNGAVTFWVKWVGFILMTVLLAWVTLKLTTAPIKNDFPLKTSNFRYLQDSSQKESFAQVQARKQAALALEYANHTFHFDRTKSAHWVLFDVVTQASNRMENCLLLDITAGTKIELFLSNKHSELIPASAIKKVEGRKPIYCFELPTHQTYQISLRLQHDYELILASLYPSSLKWLNQHQYQATLVLSMVFGGFFVLLGYNIFLYFSVYEKGYLYLAAALLAVMYELGARYNLLLLSDDWLQFTQWFFPSVILYLCAALSSFILLIFRDLTSAILVQIFRTMIGFFLGFSVIIPWLDHSYAWTYWIVLVGLLVNLGAIIYASYLGSQFARSTVSMAFFATVAVVCALVVQLGIVAIPSFEILYFCSLLMTAVSVSFWQNFYTRELYKRFTQVQSTNKARERLLATVSHELRTPMHTLMGIGHLLSQKEHKHEQNYLEQLQLTSEHMLMLIDDLLDMSCLENKILQLNLEPFYFPDLVYRLEALFDVPIKGKGLAFEVVIEGDSKVWLLGDEQRLKQVIVNLLGNAVKYTKQGKVTLRFKLVEASPELCHLYCKVSDTGIGIAENELSQLFDSFYQAEDVHSREHGGVGLGLSISDQLIKMMGGQIGVSSQPAQGSQFFFSIDLPIKPAEKQPQVGLQTPSFAFEQMDVLLVDDDVINAKLGQHLLETKGIQAQIAHSGAAAIQHIKKQCPDIVFMDISMPEMSGYETVAQLRKQSEYIDLPIIALTAHAIMGERERCLEAGMNDYLTKPFSLEEILLMINQYSQKDYK